MKIIENCKDLRDAQVRYRKNPDNTYLYPVDNYKKKWERYDPPTKLNHDISSGDMTFVVLDAKSTVEDIEAMKTQLEKVVGKAIIYDPISFWPSLYVKESGEDVWQQL